MNEAKRRFILSGLKLFDTFLLTLSFGLATILVARSDQRFGFEQFLSMRIKLSNCTVFVLILLLWHMIFSLCGLYESRRLSSRRLEIVDVVKACAISTALLALMAVFLRITMITPRFLASFWIVGTFLLVSWRLTMRPLLASLRRRGRNLRYMLIVGTNSRAIEFARKIQEKPELGYRLVGFVDDDWQSMDEFKKTGFPLVSDLAGLTEFVRRNVVDELAIYLPVRSFYEHSLGVAALCEQHGIIMRFNGDIFGLKKSRPILEEFDGDHQVATYAGTGDDWWPLVVKRMLDIAFSFILLLLLSPVFVIVAVLIKFSSGGPIFFRQERLGLNKRRFPILKFRTMVPNAEEMMAELEVLNEVSGPVFKIKEDPRITPIGKVLRRTSIDELPQLFNVLLGDMSLVGPRPLPIRDYEGFSDDWQRRRFSVRPGITCLWQVNGRSAIPFEQWMKLDLQYMDEWSLWLDIKILARTVSVVLKGIGAA
jgi:exopolysaccharide biosynthesis polyprenyl glycosylphosphotransferase